MAYDDVQMIVLAIDLDDRERHLRCDALHRLLQRHQALCRQDLSAKLRYEDQVH